MLHGERVRGGRAVSGRSSSLRVLPLAVLAAVWGACSSPPRLEVPPPPPPLVVPPGAPSVTLKSFRASIREGVLIGRAYPGGPLRWSALLNQSRYEEIGRRELRALGLPGPDLEGDPFEEDLGEARFWIAATLVRWEYDAYPPASEGRARFLWQVYDTALERVRLEHTGYGYARASDHNALEPAFLDGLRRFTATPEFAGLLSAAAARP